MGCLDLLTGKYNAKFSGLSDATTCYDQLTESKVMAKLLPPKNVREADCKNCNYCVFLQQVNNDIVCIRGNEDDGTLHPFFGKDDDYANIHTTVCDRFERKS